MRMVTSTTPEAASDSANRANTRPSWRPKPTPLAQSFTDQLAAPTAEPMPSGNQLMLRQRVAASLERAVGTLSGDNVNSVSAQALHRAGLPTPGSELTERDTSFSWRPDRVRRTLGLLAAARYLQGDADSVADAVDRSAELAVSTWRRTGRMRHYWEPWLAVLGAPIRAEVLAQATTWAAGLLTSINWSVLRGWFEIGPHDALWALPPDHHVRLKSRSDVRVVLSPCADHECLPPQAPAGLGHHEALVIVMGGCPSPIAEATLSYVALVEGLRHATRPLPARVGGLWPDAGEFRVVDIDASRLAAAIDLSAAFLRRTSARQVGQPAETA